MPYQTVSQHGFVYTLVPYRPELEPRKKAQNKMTQTAVPTCTLGIGSNNCRTSIKLKHAFTGTQTRFLNPSRGSQTGLSLAPSSTLMMTSSELYDAMDGTSQTDVPLQHQETQIVDAEIPAATVFNSSISGMRCSTPLPSDTTAESVWCVSIQS